MYGSWDMEHYRQNFLSFWMVFCPFTPLWTQKIKIWKNEKNTWRYHFTNVCHKWLSYNVWFLRYVVQWTEFFVILDPFFALYPLPPPNLKYQIFEKNEKTARRYYDNHMMYGSWDTKIDGHNFLSFWTIFCTLTLLTIRKIKILKNWKKRLEIGSFYTSTPKIMIICYTVPYLFICNYLMLVHQNSSSLIKTN